ncbi:putative transcriptional regulator, TetR family [Pseudarthrobacter chlorophenolicus A6]|uniref:Transcriptional regulator, TetR family n=1 Tax=Pseudarthrobacter chlorophenolicus (strain ATCC 700700 / DSM 12829 / CIP 107037 / JCM 12360 / KCTC 9906 / NCIMB 13794 / A6) TaxID=452863 RepID=B8H8Z6_PSECP|nr:TetR/AcrR family transcriptional regulator [Pseudarthrobacter chlorophenolicus]ACL38155.1 putative transcriptional regulator, TetR family [Pseudarthrobacter chlorophenolicus A6]SDQ54330.1 DNA-binding transcriptional regulator, AcrR family [Pseudarthrobacter chlorophenolicus]
MSPSPREQANAAVLEFLSQRDWSTQTPAKKRILLTFLRLAAANGYNSVSMRTLGRELGVRAPSLYSSFPQGKDQITADSLLWFTHGFAQELLERVQGIQCADDYWAALVRFHVTQQIGSPEPDLWNLLVASDKVAGFLGEGLREELACWQGLHEAMYAAAAEEMGLAVTRQAIQAIFALLDRAAHWSAWDGTAAQLENLADRGVALSRSLLVVSAGSGPGTWPELSQHGTTPLIAPSIL